MELPVTWTSWLLAFLPLAILLILMLVAKWGIAQAGPVAWGSALLVAWLYFEAPGEMIGFESVKGTWSAVTVLYVVWASILLYEVTRASGAFEPLRRGISKALPHPLLQVLAFGFVFSSFLQGVTGFGVPIAVCAPLLVGIGVRPLYAVIVPLVGHAWNNTFGTLGVAWLGLREVTNLEGGAATATALYAAAFIWILNALGALLVCWLYGRFNGVRQGLPAIAVISTLHGGLTLALAGWSTTLNGFIAGSAAFGAIFVVAKLPRYRTAPPFTSHIFRAEVDTEYTQISAATGPGTTTRDGVKEDPKLTVNRAFIPYYALILITFGILLIPPLKNRLETITISLNFPDGVTGLGFENAASESSFAPFTHAGTFLLLAAIVGYLAFKSMGCMKKGSLRQIVHNTADKSIPSTIAVVALIAMSNVMAGSGMVDVLAHGVASLTGDWYGILAPIVGGIGSFMTTSNLASNLLFGTFQASTAQATGLSSAAILGAQTAGGAAGNMIAPGNVLLGTTTAGILGKEGAVLRVTIPLFLGVTAIVGVAVLLVA